MRKVLAASMVLAGLAALPVTTSTSAEAYCRGCWIGAGVAGAVIAGAAIASAPYYGYGYAPYGYAYRPYPYRPYAYRPYAYAYPPVFPYAPGYYGVGYGTPSPFYGARY